MSASRLRYGNEEGDERMERGKRKETIHPHPTGPVVKSYTRRARFSGTFLDNVNVKVCEDVKL